MNTILLAKPVDLSPTARPRLSAGLLTEQRLQAQNRCFKDTGGVSKDNRAHGFRPAFLDTCTGAVYLSRFKDGQVAPIHLLDGLPPELVYQCTATGRIVAIKDSVIAGFVNRDRFYTRQQAAVAVQEKGLGNDAT